MKNIYFLYSVQETFTEKLRLLGVKKLKKNPKIIQSNSISEGLKKLNLKQGACIIFCDNLSSIFVLLAEDRENLEKTFTLEFNIMRGEVYNIKLLSFNLILEFKDTNKFWDKNEKIKNKIKNINLTKEENEGELEAPRNYTMWKNLYDILKPKITTDAEKLSSFYGEKRTIEPKNTLSMRKDLIKIKKNLIENLEIMEKMFIELDNRFKLFILSWFMYSNSFASVSKKIFKNKFNPYSIKIKTQREEDALIRESYVGGRCEVFGNKENTEDILYYFDFNNMYGNIMLEEFPIGKGDWGKEEEIKKDGFYWVKVESKDQSIPILPHRKFKTKQDEYEIIFSNGKFEGVYTKEELNFFLENKKNKLISIEKSLTYDNSAPVLKNFAESMMELRSNDLKYEFFWKKILVSVYGTLGMRPVDTKTIIIDHEGYGNASEEYDIEKELWVGGFCIAEVKKKEKEDWAQSKVLLASIIASKARIKLARAVFEFESLGAKILYVDTDCCFMTIKKKKSKELEKRMSLKGGKTLKLKDAVFASIKNYSILKENNEWETKISGISRNYISFDEFKKRFYGKWIMEYYFSQDKDNIFNYNNWVLSQRMDIKNYSKRIFSIDKKKTNPLLKIENNYIEDKINF